MLKNDFECTNFAVSEFIILVGLTMTLFGEKKFNAYFKYMHKWFDAQLDQKILEGI